MRKWGSKSIFTNPMFITFVILFIVIAIMIYWYYIRQNWYKKMKKKLLQFQGIKFSHLTSEEQSGQEQVGPAVNNTDSHFLKFVSSGSGKTFFLRNYLSRGKSNHVVFGRDSSEFPDQNFIPLLQLEKIGIELLANKIVKLGDAGAYKSPKTKVQDLFRFGRHHNIPVI